VFHICGVSMPKTMIDFIFYGICKDSHMAIG
jgi:hypothetical protein